MSGMPCCGGGGGGGGPPGPIGNGLTIFAGGSPGTKIGTLPWLLKVAGAGLGLP